MDTTSPEHRFPNPFVYVQGASVVLSSSFFIFQSSVYAFYCENQSLNHLRNKNATIGTFLSLSLIYYYSKLKWLQLTCIHTRFGQRMKMFNNIWYNIKDFLSSIRLRLFRNPFNRLTKAKMQSTKKHR